MVAGWSDALEAQTDLIRMPHSQFGKMYLDGLAKDMWTGNEYQGYRFTKDERLGRSGLYWAVTALRDCEPCYVSSSILDLVDHARESFTLEAMYPHDLFCPSGFAYLERPITLMNPAENEDHPLDVWAFSWIHEPALPHVLQLAMFVRYDFDDEDGPGFVVPGMGLLWPLAIVTIRFGEPPKDLDSTATGLAGFVQVFFRLAQQKIAARRSERVPRPVWKRAAASWKPVKEVTVFTLRRYKSPHTEGEERDVGWSYRWMVRGHWRNQPYKAPGGGTIHQQIWIAPFIKGPPDKPLVLKRRAWRFTR